MKFAKKINFGKILKNKKFIKTLFTISTTMIIHALIQDKALAIGYTQPVQLNPIFEFIDWFIFLIRLIVSAVIGLIATIAGYKWGTDLSGSGQTEAKKILKNCAAGAFWVWAGSIVAKMFIDKLEEILS